MMRALFLLGLTWTCLLNPLMGSAQSIFGPPREAVLRVAKDQAEDILRRAEHLAKWHFPASTNPANDRFIPVGPDFDWATNPTGDPEFLHAAFRVEWAPDMVLADALADDAPGKTLDALVTQLRALDAVLRAAGDPVSDPEARNNPAWRAINVAIRCWSLLQAESLLPATMDPDRRALFDRIIARDLAWLSVHARARLGRNAARLSNWDVLVARALVGSAALPQQSDRSQNHSEIGLALLLATMEKNHRSDGMLWEAAIHYHVQVTRWYAEALLVAMAHDLPVPDAALAAITRMDAVTRNFVHADGREPAISDSDRDQLGLRTIVYVDALLDRTTSRTLPAEALLGFPGRQVDTPPARSPIYDLPASGYTIVRSTDGTGSLIVDYGPKGGWHGHLDLLSFELFDHGELLIVDPGRWLYRKGDADRDWVTSTPAHNTISIAGESHRVVEDEPTDTNEIEILHHDKSDQEWHIALRHRGYDHLPGKPIVSREMQTRYDGRYFIHDQVTAQEPVPVTISFLTPTRDVTRAGNTVIARIGDTELNMQFHNGDGWDIALAESWHSPVYGIKEPATRITLSATCSQCALRYEIYTEEGVPAFTPSAGTMDPTAIERLTE